MLHILFKKYDVTNVAYYNILIQKNRFEEKYELDYYGVPTKVALLDLKKQL